MNRLRELQRAEKLTQQELADIAEVSKRTIQNWEDGTSNIKPKKAKKLADYFGVSVGYLLGYDDNDFEKQIRIDALNDIINQMNRLKELRKEKGLTQTDLAELLEVTKLTISNWENGKHEIKADKANEIANLFNVPVSYLLGYDDNDFEKQIRIDTLNDIINHLHKTHISLFKTTNKTAFWAGFEAAELIVQTQKKMLEFEDQEDE